jgi:hypothetical protein
MKVGANSVKPLQKYLVGYKKGVNEYIKERKLGGK